MVDLSLMLSGKSSQLNADDLDAAGRIIKITHVKDTGGEQPLALYFEGDLGRPFLPCLTMRRVLAHIWGTNGTVFVGRKLLVYRDADVTWGGKNVGGVRIKGASHIDAPISYTATLRKGKRKTIMIEPIPSDEGRPAEVVKTPIAPDASQKEGRSGKSPREMVEAVQNTNTVTDLQNLTGDETFKKRREWLKSNRPNLSEQVERAVSDALARFETMDEEFPA